MYCPEHLVFKALDEHVYLWMYWRDVPRDKIPLRVWLNPLRYELAIRISTRRSRIITINPNGRMAVIAINKWSAFRDALRIKFTT